MPRDMAMQRPQARVVRADADQRPPVRIDRYGVSAHGIGRVDAVVARPVEVAVRSHGHDPELVAVQVERVRALVEGVYQEVHDVEFWDGQDELGGCEGAAETHGVEGCVVGVQPCDGLVECGNGLRDPGCRVDVRFVQGVVFDLKGHVDCEGVVRSRGFFRDERHEFRDIEVLALELQGGGPVDGFCGQGLVSGIGVGQEREHVGI